MRDLYAQQTLAAAAAGWLAPFSPAARPAVKGQPKPQARITRRQLAITSPADLDWPQLDRALDWLQRQQLLSDAQLKRLIDDAVTNAEAGAQTLEHSIAARVNAELRESLKAGEGRDAWRDRISGVADLTEDEAETIGRTFGHRAYTQGYEDVVESSPRVQERFPFWLFQATDDTRVRDHHFALDGKVAYRGSTLAKRMRAILDEWNCRCTRTAITVEKALELGIDDMGDFDLAAWKEAQKKPQAKAEKLPPDKQPDRVRRPSEPPPPLLGVRDLPLSSRLKSGQEVRFVPDPKEQADRTVVLVDPKKFDTEWRKEEGFYVGEGGKGASAVKGRYERAKEFIDRAEEPVWAPRASFDPDKKKAPVGFVDGRHRYAVLRDQGAEQVPMSVPLDQAEDFAKRYGVHPDAVLAPAAQSTQQQAAIRETADRMLAAWQEASPGESAARLQSQIDSWVRRGYQPDNILSLITRETQPADAVFAKLSAIVDEFAASI